ncbi:MAG: hypothetical protein ACKVQU_09315 [Burkholderiales bacterium]
MTMHEPGHVQSIQISPQALLIGVPDGRSWVAAIDKSAIKALPVSKIAAGHASLAASLVEGALYAGLTGNGDSTTETERNAALPKPYTLSRYIRWLVGNYVFAAQTPGLFRRGAARFDATGRADLAAFARKKAEEEEGHSQLAYRDLEGLGLPAEQVVRLVEPPSANIFAEQFRSYVESSTPIALFGFSYSLERMAVERDAAFIRKIEAICPPGVHAFRFLKVHSTIGSDSTHVHEQLSYFASLTNEELATIASAVYETARLLARQSFMDDVLSDDEIERRFRRDGIETVARPSARPTPEGVRPLQTGDR